jgi:hypothetical protein
MKFLFAGGKCDNNCFAKYGGCNVHKERPEDQKELSWEEVDFRLGKFFGQGEKEVFLYTPDLFSDHYYESIYQHLPCYEGGFGYIAVNAGVRSFIDRKIDPKELIDHGIREIWFGVESGSKFMREKYGKPNFTNAEVAFITKELQRFGIHACWYLLDSKDDSEFSRLAAYELIRECEPYRIRIWALEDSSETKNDEPMEKGKG